MAKTYKLRIEKKTSVVGEHADIGKELAVEHEAYVALITTGRAVALDVDEYVKNFGPERIKKGFVDEKVLYDFENSKIVASTEIIVEAVIAEPTVKAKKGK